MPDRRRLRALRPAALPHALPAALLLAGLGLSACLPSLGDRRTAPPPVAESVAPQLMRESAAPPAPAPADLPPPASAPLQPQIATAPEPPAIIAPEPSTVAALEPQAVATREPPAEAPSESPPVASGAASDLSAMAAYHNVWRRKVKAPDLTWSPKLAALAAEWAQQLIPSGCVMRHRPDNRYGENLAWANGPLGPEEVVELWADEHEDYDYRKNTCAKDAVCNHYTQMVWASTREVGCGVAHCGSAEVWVCNYNPPGNLNRRRPY